MNMAGGGLWLWTDCRSFDSVTGSGKTTVTIKNDKKKLKFLKLIVWVAEKYNDLHNRINELAWLPFSHELP